MGGRLDACQRRGTACFLFLFSWSLSADGLERKRESRKGGGKLMGAKASNIVSPSTGRSSRDRPGRAASSWLVQEDLGSGMELMGGIGMGVRWEAASCSSGEAWHEITLLGYPQKAAFGPAPASQSARRGRARAARSTEANHGRAGWEEGDRKALL